MARPEKNFVDYFPFTIKGGETLTVLEEKYKAKGTGFFTNMLRVLGHKPDHYLCIAEESSQIYFFAKTKVPVEEGMDMLNLMVQTKKIDKRLWEEKMVIFCPDFLISLKDAYKNRKQLMITIEQVYRLFNLKYEGKPTEDKENDAIRSTLIADTEMHSQVAEMFTLTPKAVLEKLIKFFDQYSDHDMGTSQQVKTAFIKDLQRFKQIKKPKHVQPTETEM